MIPSSLYIFTSFGYGLYIYLGHGLTYGAEQVVVWAGRYEDHWTRHLRKLRMIWSPLRLETRSLWKLRRGLDIISLWLRGGSRTARGKIYLESMSYGRRRDI
jgi:hypothetical protein